MAYYKFFNFIANAKKLIILILIDFLIDFYLLLWFFIFHFSILNSISNYYLMRPAPSLLDHNIDEISTCALQFDLQ